MNQTLTPSPHHTHSHENTVPRPALIMAGSLVALSILLTATVSFGYVDREAVPQVREVIDMTDHEAGVNPYYR